MPWMNRVEALLDRILSQRWVLHTIFWLSIIVVYVFFLGKQSENYFQTFVLVLLLIPVVMATSYFLNYRLIPNYLMKERYVKFIVYFIYTILGSLFIEMFIIILLFISLADSHIKNMNPASTDIFFLLAALLMVVFLAGAIRLLGYWRKSRDNYQALMKEKVETELRFLKSQLNPHFLFNTLNNLYYLSTQKSDKTPKAILALSEILDYVLHSGKTSVVSLQKEMEQMNNYIHLELLRYEDKVNVSITTEGDISHWSLPPMTLLTLLENAFKHGVMPMVDQAWITISIVSTPTSLDLLISNSCMTEVIPGRGIGLQNLKNQWQLLYGEQFAMTMQSELPNRFDVKLQLTKTV
jgi:hypothetical protein